MPHTYFNLLFSLKCIMKKIIHTTISVPISSWTFTVFRFKEQHTKQFVYRPFNWYWHIRVDTIYLTYSWTYMTVYFSYSVGQTHLSSFLLQKNPTFFNTRLLFSQKGIHLLTLRKYATHLFTRPLSNVISDIIMSRLNLILRKQYFDNQFTHFKTKTWKV